MARVRVALCDAGRGRVGVLRRPECERCGELRKAKPAPRFALLVFRYGFSEQAALATANEIGSSAGVAAISMVMGIARYTFGKVAEAHSCFAVVSKMLDAIPSIWHIPIIHQFAALSIYGLPAAEREAHLADAEANIAALRHLSGHCPENYAHRVALVEAERARVSGDHAEARKGFERAISLADAEGWVNDVALAHELAAKCTQGAASAGHAQSARAAWKRWGAVAKLGQQAES